MGGGGGRGEKFLPLLKMVVGWGSKSVYPGWMKEGGICRIGESWAADGWEFVVCFVA